MYGRRNGKQEASGRSVDRIKGLAAAYLPTKIKHAEYELNEAEKVQAMLEGKLEEAKRQKQDILDMYQQSNDKLGKALSVLTSAEDEVEESMKSFERARVDVNTAEDVTEASRLVTKAKRAALDELFETEREFS